MRRDLTK